MNTKTIENLASAGDNYTTPAKVIVLMCTYNGGKYLVEQLNSIERQTYPNWMLIVSDDNSNDNTYEIIKKFQSDWGAGRLNIIPGPGCGFVRNFLSLTCCDDIYGDFFSWSDQDDIWEADKIETALNWLKTIPCDRPALYCGRTKLICGQNDFIGYSPLFSRPAKFKNALVQSIAGGNTMIFNQAARNLLCEAGDDLRIPSHDWWIYQLVTGAGGVVHYDPIPKVKYRQHDENIMGSNTGLVARLIRMKLLCHGRFREWTERNIQALGQVEHQLSTENKLTLDKFKRAREMGLLRRIAHIHRVGLYRQTFLGNLGLCIAAIFKKI